MVATRMACFMSAIWVAVWMSAVLHSSLAQCPTHCVDATQCPPNPAYEDFSTHYYRLTEVDKTISITCTRTCGECFEDYWDIRLEHKPSGPNIAKDDDWTLLTDRHIQNMESNHPEFAVRLNRAPNISNCTTNSTALVNSSLDITLKNKTVASTTEDLIVSCSIRCRCRSVTDNPSLSDYFALHATSSVVIHLPLTSNSTFGESECPSGSGSGSSSGSGSGSGYEFARSDVGLTWPNLAVAIVVSLIGGGLIGIVCGVIIGICIASRCDPHPPIKRAPPPTRQWPPNMYYN